MIVDIGVVAYVTRQAQAEKLAADVDARILNVDNGIRGCAGNHRFVLESLSHSKADYVLILEDDAQVVDGFLPQLHTALDAAPTGIVSLYLGTGRPAKLQHRIRAGLAQADKLNVNWLVSRRLLHGVAYAIRPNLIRPMLDHPVLGGDMPIDEAVTLFAMTRERSIGGISYTIPSLVDHADEDTTFRHVDGPRNEPRKAWTLGRRDHWTRNWVSM